MAKAFKIEWGFGISEIKEFAAIGHGREFALAALHLGQSVHDAIKVACRLDLYCEEPINVIVLGDEDE